MRLSLLIVLRIRQFSGTTDRIHTKVQDGNAELLLAYRKKACQLPKAFESIPLPVLVLAIHRFGFKSLDILEMLSPTQSQTKLKITAIVMMHKFCKQVRFSL